MILYSSNLPYKRAQPWLGTLVDISVTGLAGNALNEAVVSAFQQVALVHRLMSFFDASSDVSRLNTAESTLPVKVHPHTYTVLQCAVDVASFTRGAFDPTVGSELTRWNLLPAGENAKLARGTWQDIEFLPESFVRLHRPVCLDLGGIAKGFAVDLATEDLQTHGALRTVVNAGGDIRVSGDNAEWIALATEPNANGDLPVIALENGSVASSCGKPRRRTYRGITVGPHVDGVSRLPARTDRFASVLSTRCMLADALTKVVLAQGRRCEPALQHFGATAYVQDTGADWEMLSPEGYCAAA